MDRPETSFAYRKPSAALLALLVTIGCIWVLFAVSINWSGAGMDAFALFAGSGDAVLAGQIWRLLTAAVMHAPDSPWHALVVILLLYFFAPPLEARWGTGRLFAFFAAASTFSFGTEVALHALFPAVGAPVWFGGMVIADAATVAWAFGARHQIVRLFFLIPVRPLVMVALLALWHVLLLIARTPSPEGLFAPFGAMAAGYLLSDGSPLRKAYLRLKLQRLRARVRGLARGEIDADDDEPPPDRSMLH